ncbi:4-hydroxy-tetrahydrodipicolinate synthase [Enterococcus hulanensis]|uniref:4-hydroxy-tetrahydrodipicolinate synthase n=1 Tax=Enterococcus hulanensis TaxID=2559929 RepID=A0ABU3EVX7_9ENTE|nr:4-hydroxy-tetrahydrodipicolinate synthase [Enterococcus hulanensis]MDT2599018.1 4-hydroxy-tetrahydrodipicolinate synthase [Enterococcus hulanensis]MDT2610669.1 4-hydroxy-tetrahydrodipicolinate synthase [Enterococcus hulanensis]MDT2614773.1 4-hydroxy-tetrahydrodipicolinate synthase [Enterococcus hulanensis]MDT2627257.1 4-hydroxy-tetrahydrodipicolinate synthase [Enterococcus hulanensis]MDT2653843.1 4-hydroxy-tetrahydrodipicolinate synthase [Enterococcus hulanensis]
MKQTELKGIITPILTPMNEDESINLEELRAQVERMIENGIHGIFPFGTNGEGYILTAEEKKSVLETVVDQCNGRVPIYAGTGTLSTKETIEQSKMAQAAGADVLSLITPSFAAASQEELYTHYKTVAEAVDMPIVLYNIPARTGNAIAPATVGRLAEIENIIGAKDSSGNFANILGYIDAGKKKQNGKFYTLSGNDQLIIWTLLAGGTGGIAGCANVYPQTMASIYDLFVEGKIEEAKKANESIQSFRACFKYGNPNTIVKTATRLLGHNVGSCRAPFNQIPEEGIEAIKKVLEENKAKGMK